MRVVEGIRDVTSAAASTAAGARKVGEASDILSREGCRAARAGGLVPARGPRRLKADATGRGRRGTAFRAG